MQNWTTEIKELTYYYHNLSNKIPDLETELNKLIKSDDEVVLLLYSRRCLEVIVTDICEKESVIFSKTVALKGQIDKLKREKIIPAHIISSMYNLNNISTYGAHPKEFDPRQVQTVLINLITVIAWYINYRNFGIINSGNKTDSNHNTVKKEKHTQTDIITKTSYESLNFWQELNYYRLQAGRFEFRL